MFRSVATVLLLILAFVTGCSHRKAKTDLNRANLRNKVVALVDVNGAKEAKLQTEIAIVNEIIAKGRFQIIDRTTVQSALVEHPTEAERKALVQKIHADLLLNIDILEFKVESKKGYDTAEEEDSLLSSEHRTNRGTKWKHYYKVKAQEGYVNIRLRFFDVRTGGVILDQESQATRTYNSRDGDLPRNMRILEELTQQAVSAFFDNMAE